MNTRPIGTVVRPIVKRGEVLTLTVFAECVFPQKSILQCTTLLPCNICRLKYLSLELCVFIFKLIYAIVTG